jgi:hypothetical protein
LRNSNATFKYCARILNAAKDKCIFLNTRLEVTDIDAAAAFEAVAALAREKVADKGTNFQRLRGYLPGRNKWKNMAKTLFGMTYIKHFLIMLTVKHIHDEVYTNTKLAEAILYRVPVFSLRGVEGFRIIQTKKRDTTDGVVKREHQSDPPFCGTRNAGNNSNDPHQ